MKKMGCRELVSPITNFFEKNYSMSLRHPSPQYGPGSRPNASELLFVVFENTNNLWRDPEFVQG